MENGFTLFEILLVVTLVAILATTLFGLPVRFADSLGADAAIQTVGVAAERAQSLAYAMVGDQAWSIHVASSSAVVFQGATYASRDESADEVFVFPVSISVATASDNDIIFGKGTGVPAGDATIRLMRNDLDREVTISSGGLIFYAP